MDGTFLTKAFIYIYYFYKEIRLILKIPIWIKICYCSCVKLILKISTIFLTVYDTITSRNIFLQHLTISYNYHKIIFLQQRIISLP